jgi:hypothetical protein
MFTSILPLVAGIIALSISGVLFYKYFSSKKMYHLLWALGMFLWAISDFTQFYAFIAGWNVPVYIAYFFSSIMLAGFLGAGTLYLVLPKGRIPKFYLYFNIVGAIALLLSVTVIPINTTALSSIVTGANPVSSAANYIAAVINIPALFTFVGGALYSFVKWRKIYALLIAIGGAVPAVGGIFAAIAFPALLPYTDIIGIIILGIAFYLSFRGKPQKEKKK